MKAKTNIGLDKSQRDNLAKKLNELLANYMMFYQNYPRFAFEYKRR